MMHNFAQSTLVDRWAEGGKRSYRYIVEFKNVRALQRFVLDDHDKIAAIQSEAASGNLTFPMKLLAFRSS